MQRITGRRRLLGPTFFRLTRNWMVLKGILRMVKGIHQNDFSHVQSGQ